eukprot:PhF_6_TR2227/c0_g1_i1/m.3734
MLQVDHSNPVGMNTDTYDSLDNAFDSYTNKFRVVARDIRLMFLESMLYKKYFIDATRTEEKLAGLHTLLQIMVTHKQNTLNVLKHIHERENIVKKIKELAMDFTRGRIATLEVQTKVLQLLWLHQQITLSIVEGIQEWRSLLTRPYPFNWNKQNYFLKILEDCTFIDTCQLNNILPLHLTQFPLCSNVTSLSLFAPQHSVTGKPPKSSKSGLGGTPSADLQHRLVLAEKTLFDEDLSQRAVMRELMSLASKQRFVTVLNVQSIIPECTTGIHVSKREWDEKLQQALGSIFESVAPDPGAPGMGGGGGGGTHTSSA